ncbi:MAG: dethiobiotin synthase [Chitinophagales bacterium]|nr:dethiobiotin synthase [Chitinophagales bacterium]
MKRIFVTGIGTGIGKTVVSAILAEALKADYWKPIQAGDLKNTDTMKVKSLVTNKRSKYYPEAFCLTQPMSPHASALNDNIKIKSKKLKLPKHKSTLIIEGAGGLMVPINKNYLMIDLIEKLKADVILVSQNYLGSINHTLLSVEALQHRNIPIKGIVFNGNPVKTTEKFILQYTGLKFLFRIHNEKKIDKQTILKYATVLTKNSLLKQKQ